MRFYLIFHQTVYIGGAMMALRTGDYEKAFADYSKAIRVDTKCAGAYYGRGCVYRKKGDKVKADEDFARTKELGYKPQ